MTITLEDQNINVRQKLIRNNQRYGIKGKQILESNSVNETRSLINSGRKNFIINGNFDIWQRNTTQTSSGYGSADRWKMDSGRTLGRSIDVPNTKSLYSGKITPTTGGFVPTIYTSIELNTLGNPGPLKSNTDYTLSYYIKAGSNVGISEIIQYRTGVIGFSESILYSYTTPNITTGQWQKREITFNTSNLLPNVGNNVLEIQIATNEADGIMYITQVQLEEGNNATDFEYRPIAEELALCQRYYQKSYDLNIVPGTINSNGEIKESAIRNLADNLPGIYFNTTMRAVPSVVLYSPITGLIGNVANNGNVSAIVQLINTNGFGRIIISTGDLNFPVEYHYTVDAEL